MSVATIAALLLGAAIVVVLVWGRRQREESRLLARQLATLEVERDVAQTEIARWRDEQALLGRFLADLASAMRRFLSAASEREIPAVLLDAAVTTLAPGSAMVAVRRKRAEGTGRRWVVAAFHPRDAPGVVGAEVTWAEAEADPGTHPSGSVRRRAQTAMPEIDGAARPGSALPGLEWAVPMLAEGEVVGIIALSETPHATAVATTVLKSLATVGAVAFSQAAARQRTRTNAQIDELTLLFNRRHILRVLSEELRRCQQQRHELSVFLFDVDHFKRYNDVNGHMTGDVLLRLLAEFVLKHVRASDTVGRFGGEEFLIILPHTAAVQAIRVANGLRALIASEEFPQRLQQPLGAVTVSGGVAQFPVHGASVSTLLRAADQALYCAKRDGRNRVVCADVPPLDAHYESADLEEELD